MAILFQPDGTEQTVLPRNGTDFALGEAQKWVGGDIEVLTLPDGRILIINEEGKFQNLPFNQKASYYGGAAGMQADDFVVGPALLCKSEELK